MLGNEPTLVLHFYGSKHDTHTTLTCSWIAGLDFFVGEDVSISGSYDSVTAELVTEDESRFVSLGGMWMEGKSMFVSIELPPEVAA